MFSSADPPPPLSANFALGSVLKALVPKRSNDFQKLVFLVKKHLAVGAKVTESKMLADLATGADREVDVFIETTVGGHDVAISIECIDHKRPADVTWIEKMKAKHERLETNVLVLCSRSGCSAEAKNDVSSADGKHQSTVGGLVEDILRSDEAIMELGRRGDDSHKYFDLIKPNIADEDGFPLYLQKIEPKVLREIELIRVQGGCRINTSPMPLRHGSLGGVSVSWGTGEIDGIPAILVATEDEAGKPHLSIKLGR